MDSLLTIKPPYNDAWQVTVIQIHMNYPIQRCVLPTLKPKTKVMKNITTTKKILISFTKMKMNIEPALTQHHPLYHFILFNKNWILNPSFLKNVCSITAALCVYNLSNGSCRVMKIFMHKTLQLSDYIFKKQLFHLHLSNPILSSG